MFVRSPTYSVGFSFFSIFVVIEFNFMEKPVIKDKKTLAYVEWLEEKLKTFESEEVRVHLYLAVRKQAHDLAKLLSDDVEIILENGEKEHKPFMDFHTLSSKDDKFFDRYEKLMKLWRQLGKDLKEAEEELSPEVIQKIEKKVSGSIADSFVFETKDGKD